MDSMSRYREWPLDCKVYVGGLAINTAKHEIEEAFNKYGPMKNVWVARNPPGFAFVEFEDPRDAEDAVRSMDGIRLNGTRIRCEMSHGKTRNGGGGRRGGSGGGGGGNRFSPARRNRHETRNRSRSRSPPPSGRRPRTRSRSRSPKSRSPRSKSRSPARWGGNYRRSSPGPY